MKTHLVNIELRQAICFTYLAFLKYFMVYYLYIMTFFIFLIYTVPYQTISQSLSLFVVYWVLWLPSALRYVLSTLCSLHVNERWYKLVIDWMIDWINPALNSTCSETAYRLIWTRLKRVTKSSNCCRPSCHTKSPWNMS